MNFLPAMTLLEYSCMTRPKKEFKGKRTENEALFLIPNLVKSRTNMQRTITRDQSPNVKAIAFFAKIQTIGCVTMLSCRIKSNIVVVNMSVFKLMST